MSVFVVVLHCFDACGFVVLCGGCWLAGLGGEATVEPGSSFLVAGVCPLVNETGNWGLWLEGSGCLRSSAHWYVSLGHEPSRGQGHVQRHWWAQRVSWQPLCWRVGLEPHPVTCLTRSIPAMVPTGQFKAGSWGWWSRGRAPSMKALACTVSTEGAPQNSYCRYLCLQGGLQVLLASQEDSPGSAGGLTQASVKSLLLPGPGVCEILCTL